MPTWKALLEGAGFKPCLALSDTWMLPLRNKTYITAYESQDNGSLDLVIVYSSSNGRKHLTKNCPSADQDSLTACLLDLEVSAELASGSAPWSGHDSRSEPPGTSRKMTRSFPQLTGGTPGMLRSKI